MSGTATPIFAQTPQTFTALLQNSTGAYTFAATGTTNLVSLAAGGTNGTIISGINVTTTDSTETLLLILNNGTNNFILSEFSIPSTSGDSTSTPPVDLFRNPLSPGLPIDVNGNRYLYLPSGYTLYVGTTSVVTSGKYTMVVAVGENF